MIDDFEKSTLSTHHRNELAMQYKYNISFVLVVRMMAVRQNIGVISAPHSSTMGQKFGICIWYEQITYRLMTNMVTMVDWCLFLLTRADLFFYCFLSSAKYFGYFHRWYIFVIHIGTDIVHMNCTQTFQLRFHDNQNEKNVYFCLISSTIDG